MFDCGLKEARSQDIRYNNGYSFILYFLRMYLLKLHYKDCCLFEAVKTIQNCRIKGYGLIEVRIKCLHVLIHA